MCVCACVYVRVCVCVYDRRSVSVITDNSGINNYYP